MSLEFNKTQVIFLLDRSGSMRAHDAPGNLSRLAYAEEKLIGYLPEVTAHDPDGVSIYCFDNVVEAHRDVADVAAVQAIVKACGPRATTRTDLAILAAWQEHLDKKNEETAVFVFTDGEPDDQKAVVDAIVSITKKIEAPEAFRVMIMTVGEQSAGLRAWLDGLDDNLGDAGAAFDIVGLGELSHFPTLQDAGNALIASTTANEEVSDTYSGIKTT